MHFLDDGFGIEIYEADGPLHITGTIGQHSSASAELVISRLTDLRPGPTTTMHYAVESATIDQPGQLVIAIMGRMTADDANSLLRLRRNRAQGLAMVIDVDTFADEPATEQHRGPARAGRPDPARQPVAGDRGQPGHQRGRGLVRARAAGAVLPDSRGRPDPR